MIDWTLDSVATDDPSLGALGDRELFFIESWIVLPSATREAEQRTVDTVAKTIIARNTDGRLAARGAVVHYREFNESIKRDHM